MNWFKNRVSIRRSNTSDNSSSSHYRVVNSKISPNNVSSRLYLTKSNDGVSFDDAGNYTCEAHSRLLNKTTRGTIDVQFIPEIQYKPSNKIKREKEDAFFFCNATGVPEPAISWLFSGPSYSTLNRFSNRITIKDVRNTEYYEGDYTCIARSTAGVAQATASLTVDVPPRIIKSLPQGVVLQLGETVILKCDVYGDPVPSFEWTRRRSTSETETTLSSQKESVLVINDVRVTDAAYYGCRAVNRAGNISLEAVLVDVDTSLAIINKGENFTAIAESNVTIRCIASSEIETEVKILRNGEERETFRKVSQDGTVVTAGLVLNPVTTEHSGIYTCVAINRQKSVEADVTLTVNVPIEVKMDVTLQDKTFTEDLKNSSSEKYKNLSSEFIEELTKVYIKEPNFDRVEIIGFENGSVAVRFRIVFKVMVMKPSEKPPPDVKTKLANIIVRKVAVSDGIVGKLKLRPDSLKPLVKPPAPSNITVFDIKKTKAKLKWNPPPYHTVYGVTSYVIEFKKFGDKELWKNTSSLDKQIEQYQLSDLEPGTNYLVRAHAINFLGKGVPTTVIEIKTLSDFMEMFLMIGVPLIVVFVIVMVIIIIICVKRRRNVGIKRADTQLELDLDVMFSFDNKTEDLSEQKRRPWREIQRDRLVIEDQIGTGAFGVVIKGKLKEPNGKLTPCAIKIRKYNEGDDDDYELLKELDTIASIGKNPNVIEFLGACTDDGPLFIVLEFAEHGNLLHYLTKNRKPRRIDGEQESTLSDQEKMRFALDVSQGMHYLAQLGCIHRDLAARNILLGTNYVAKVSPFGVARDKKGFYEKDTQDLLPYKWMSIEAIQTLKFTKANDVWAFGVLLWEIETGGRIPYEGLSSRELLAVFKSGERLKKPSCCSMKMYRIMMSCWEENPKRRPTFRSLSKSLSEEYREMDGIGIRNESHV